MLSGNELGRDSSEADRRSTGSAGGWARAPELLPVLVDEELAFHPRVRRLIQGPVGIAFRWSLALILAACFGAAISGIAGPAVIPRLPLVAELACPQGHRVTRAAPQEIYPRGLGTAAPARSRRFLLGCRDEDGRVLASDAPHFGMLWTAGAIATLALLRTALRVVNFLFRPPRSGLPLGPPRAAFTPPAVSPPRRSARRRP